MKIGSTGSTIVVLCLSLSVLSAQSIQPVAPAPAATLFRVFLKDGTTLVSYGEVARVGDRVVFSMPTSRVERGGGPSSRESPRGSRRLGSTPPNTRRPCARAATSRPRRTLTTHWLSNEVAQALNVVTTTADPDKRLAIVRKGASDAVRVAGLALQLQDERDQADAGSAR